MCVQWILSVYLMNSRQNRLLQNEILEFKQHGSIPSSFRFHRTVAYTFPSKLAGLPMNSDSFLRSRARNRYEKVPFSGWILATVPCNQNPFLSSSFSFSVHLPFQGFSSSLFFLFLHSHSSARSLIQSVFIRQGENSHRRRGRAALSARST